jgi:hypothetical protein
MLALATVLYAMAGWESRGSGLRVYPRTGSG